MMREEHCVVDGCVEATKARRMCARHYGAWIKRTPIGKRPLPPRYAGELRDFELAIEVFDLAKPDMAYLFGFLQADGTYSKSERNRGRISVELSAIDRRLLEKFQKLVPYQSTIRSRERSTNFSSHHSSVTWTLCALEARTRLEELGLIAGKKSRTVAPPVTAFSERDYLRALIDADGSVGYTANGYPFVSFTTASDAWAEYFCLKVADVTGVVRTAKRNKRDSAFNLMVINETAVELAAWLYDGDCLAIDRKREAAVRVSEWARPDGMRPRALRIVWTPEKDALILRLPAADAAEQLGHSVSAIRTRMWKLRNGLVPAPQMSGVDL